MAIATIQIPFKSLQLIIEVDVRIMLRDVPALLSMKDMVEKGLEKIIQNHHVHLAKCIHPLQMMIYILIHEWKGNHVPFRLYTEQEPKKVDRNLEHVAVRATGGILRGANG